MTKRSAQSRIDVNLEELDRVIDHGMRVPLSESDGQKIKTALHAMADRLRPKRSTEKTSAVLEKLVPEPAVPADDEGSSPAGHGRHGAAAFAGATRVSIPHATLQSGDACPECGAGKVYRQKEPATLVRIVEASAAEDDGIRDGAAEVQRLRTDLHCGYPRVCRSR